jgi:hypothetical protein
LKLNDEQDTVYRTISFGINNGNAQPIVGDWDGDGIDGLGVYNQTQFALTNDINSTLPLKDYFFNQGSTNANTKAIAGDWNGDGLDTIGTYLSTVFSLYDANSSSAQSTYTFNFGPNNQPTLYPIVGDWNGDSTDTVGVYYAGTWSMTNTNTQINPSSDYNYNFGGTGSTTYPVVGKWNDGSSIALTSLSAPSASSFKFDWADRSINNDADVSIYLDNDNFGNDGVKVVDNISEDSATDTYTWTGKDVLNGTYYAYAKLEGTNDLELVSYSINTINVVNTAPSIVTELLEDAYIDSAYVFTLEGSDAQNDTLNWELLSSIEDMNLDSQTGELTWDTINKTQANYEVIVKVSDKEFSTTKTFTLTLTEKMDYQKDISFTNSSGSAVSNHEQKIEIDTANLITEGKIKNDCSNIAFFDNSENELQYFLESGCNTVDTKIWVKVTSVAVGENTISMRYGDTIIPNFALTMNDNSYIAAFENSCPSNWNPVSNLNTAKFLMGSNVFGNGGGAENHVHTFSGITGFVNQPKFLGSSTQYSHSVDHKHTMSGTTSIGNNIPSYFDVIYCEYTIEALPHTVESTNFVGIFETLPTNWAHVAAFDGKFLRGNSTTGGVGGSDTHTHTFSGQTNTVDNRSSSNDTYGGAGSPVTFGHKHNYSGTTSGESNVPPFIEFIFANPTQTGLKLDGTSVSIFKELPPLGWNRQSNLDNKFIRGAAVFGAIGGSAEHIHNLSGTTNKNGSAGSDIRDCCNTHKSYANHDHDFAFNSATSNSLPPYVSVIFAKEKTGSLSYQIGNETEIDM